MVWVAVLVLMTALAGQDQPDSPGPGAAPLPGHKAQAKPPTAAPAPEKKPAGSSPALSGAAAEKSSATKPQSPGLAPMSTFASARRAEMAKPKSPFLCSPGGSPEDRYGPDGAVDWSDVPPWRQTSFFGIRARGQFFVYVVDCSGKHDRRRSNAARHDRAAAQRVRAAGTPAVRGDLLQ